mmetsp:Transcript_39795/g.119658  ORF Transcript_39795/g.119658 Transcript_39795/m.119658 type:complete len:215 (-) Transcript_39795:1133-1777(-)
MARGCQLEKLRSYWTIHPCPQRAIASPHRARPPRALPRAPRVARGCQLEKLRSYWTIHPCPQRAIAPPHRARPPRALPRAPRVARGCQLEKLRSYWTIHPFPPRAIASPHMARPPRAPPRPRREGKPPAPLPLPRNPPTKGRGYPQVTTWDYSRLHPYPHPPEAWQAAPVLPGPRLTKACRGWRRARPGTFWTTRLCRPGASSLTTGPGRLRAS